MTATDLPLLDAIRQAAFAPVFASFRALLGDDLYELAQARDDRAQGALLSSLLGTLMYESAIARMKAAGMRVATVSTGGDASHAPARRAYEKAGFVHAIPSVWLCRKL